MVSPPDRAASEREKRAMSNDRNTKAKPAMGIHGAVLVLAAGLSPEAVDNLLRMVKKIAEQYSYSDSTMIRRFKSQLNRAAQQKKSRSWANEILERMNGATV